MTDQELIQLLQDKAPEELSLDEIQLLRERLRHSPELLDTLRGQLQMEEYLSQALGRVAVSADGIYAAAAVHAAGRRHVLAILGWTSSLGLGIVVLLWLAFSNSDRRQPLTRQATAAAEAVPRIATLEPPLASLPSAVATEGLTRDAAVAGGDTDAASPEEEPKPMAEKVQAAPEPQANPVGSDPAVAPPPADEWPELSPKAPRRSFAGAAFEDVDDVPRGISKNQLSRWLAPVLGQHHQFLETNRGNVVVAGFDGMLRLRAPWPTDAVLALAPFDHHGLAIDFWNGRQGVSLRYYQHPRPTWAAYRTTRKGQEPQPATFALVATDNDRYDRSLAGIIELRLQSGALVMNRGDIRLLTVPFDGLPTDVYFDKHAWLRTFAMYRGEAAPDDVLTPERSLFADAAPATHAWTKQLAEGVQLNKVGDGAIELSADKGAATSWAAVKIPQLGLFEIIFRLGQASPATGVYLGDDAGKPMYALGILREQRSGQNGIGLIRPDAGNFEFAADVNQQPVPCIAAGQWLRLIAGSGTLKCWTSGDGTHWSRAFDPMRGLAGGWSHVGLMSFKTDAPRRITLEQLRICPLSAISELADGALSQQVPGSVLVGDANRAAWQTRVEASQPAGVDAVTWRKACTLRTLAAIPPAQLGNALLNELLEENLVRQVSSAGRLRVINQAAELYDAWDQPESYRLSQFYERLGKQLMREGDREPWSKAGRALFTTPLWTTAQFQTMPESLASAELLFRVYADQWDDVHQLCRRLKLYNRPAVPEQGWPDHRQRLHPLVEWAAANASRALADKRRHEKGPASASVYWQHPLAVVLSKEGFNTLAELEASLGDQSYRDACQIILGVKPELALGLLPDGRDPRLLLSLPQAVDTAMRDYPGLRLTMVEQFGTLGRLRLQQALADAGPQLLQALAVQFYGTPSAAAAHQWLGDRALADGDFAEAAAEFEIALRSADPEQKGTLAARLRLAGAMLGRDVGQPVTEPVVFQDAQMTIAAFEQLIAEMKNHAGSGNGAPLVAAEAAAQAEVKPVRYDVHGRGALPGDVGTDAGNSNAGNVDWAGRQSAGTIAGKMLFVTNRFQATAFSLITGKQHWSVPLNKEQGPTHAWGLVPMRPVVVGDRIFVRRLSKSGPELVCVHAVNSKIRWTTHTSVSVASDPLILQDRLYVFTVSAPLDNGLLSLELALVNPLTGEIMSQQPVIQLKNVWDKQLNCQAAVVGARLVAIAGGTVFCCDFSGRPLWVRRQMWIPPAQAPASSEQSAGIPLVLGNRLFVTQPGVFAVEALDLDTGRRVWQQPLPDVRRLIGISGERLVVETTRGWQAHAANTGKLLWQYDAEQLLDAHVCPTAGALVLAQRESQPNEAWRPVLVWLNPETGTETARLPIEKLTDKQPMLGPLVVDRDHLWTLFGRGLREPRREMFELTPTSDPAQPPRATAGRR